VTRQTAVTLSDIEDMAKPALFGKKVELSSSDWDNVKGLAKEGLLSRGIIPDLKNKIKSALNEIRIWKNRFHDAEAEKEKYGFTKFIQAFLRAPQRLMATISDILRKPPERTEPEHQQERKKHISHEEVL